MYVYGNIYATPFHLVSFNDRQLGSLFAFIFELFGSLKVHTTLKTRKAK